jgi:hypothetical protein
MTGYDEDKRKLILSDKVQEDEGETVMAVAAGEGVLPEDDFMGVPIDELEKAKAGALVGYMAMDMCKPPVEATWGLYNDRKIDDAWVADLIKSFKHRRSNCLESDSVEVAIRPEWLKNRDQIRARIDGLKIHEVAEMEFTDEGKKAISPDNIIMLGGNHRREALRRLMEELRTTLQRDEKAIKDKGTDIPIPESNADEARIKKEREKVKWAGHWSIKIYDRGEWNVPDDE